MQKFWEIEECASESKIISPNEKKAEDFYNQTVLRLENGNYMVRLPFKEITNELGESRQAATNRLQSMEKKFERNKELQREYSKFMKECENLNHMECMSNDSQVIYFMPHDHLLVGPPAQNDLFTILLKFR